MANKPTDPKQNDLRVWWIPQVPGKALHTPVPTLEEAVRVLAILARYDQFQLDNNIKPDYCNTGGVEIYQEKEKEWQSWYDEETGEDDPETFLATKVQLAS